MDKLSSLYQDVTSLNGLQEAFTKAFASVAASEIGDKTFFIAALMAMKHAKLPVFLGCWGALAGMTALSALFGLVAPVLIPKEWVARLAVVLFLFFGTKMIIEGLTHDATAENEERKEAEREVLGGEPEGKASKKGPKGSKGSTAISAFRVFIQALSLTFVAEWADRSQIVTMGLAASSNVLGVVLGGALGHFCITGMAVLGGARVADNISDRLVHLLGGALFVAFGAHGALEAFQGLEVGAFLPEAVLNLVSKA